jgi:phosphoglycerol transferase MdoB-like AlkP superfamily enzyme
MTTDLANPQPRLNPMTGVLLSLLRPVLIIWLMVVCARWGLALWLFDRVDAQGAWGDLLLEGFRFDGVILGLIWFLPATLLPLAAMGHRGWVWGSLALRVYGTAWFGFLFFMEWSTPAFIEEYDNRPNYVFVEYLNYLREVGPTVFAQYPIRSVLIALILPASIWAFWRWTKPPALAAKLNWWSALPLSAILFCAFALAGRGTLTHRPANPALAATTQDGVVNQLPLSSGYTLMYALYLDRKSEEGGVVYGNLPTERVLELVKAGTGADPSLYIGGEQQPTLRRQVPLVPSTTPQNLVIVLEESMGAEFVKRLGGEPVTPHLEKLSQQGIWFDQLYATGTRSVRGIEAVIAGFPPTSAPSTVKLARSQQDFFTLAQFLKRQGYTSTFYYGGESHFDNMRSWFMGNGFDAVVDEKDFPNNVFKGTWGVSDEAVLDLAHENFSKPNGNPFFGLVFTSSNHAPFEFPDGAIELHDAPKGTVNNAVKYADHALGRFFEKAKKSNYWNNTIFLVVADHNSRVYGNSLIPIKRFHIPGLILGGRIQPQVVTAQTSQIDLAPTLISLLGLTGEHPMIGRDMLNPVHARGVGRAIMQFDKVQAYMEGKDVVVLRPDLPPEVMTYDASNGELSPGKESKPDLVEKAVAHSLFAPMAYRQAWHR